MKSKERNGENVFLEYLIKPQLADQAKRFFTGMDCYIHSVEAISGHFINDFSRVFAEKSIELCEKVFLLNGSDGELMIASSLGGFSIVYSEVGICHALSYALSHYLGYHHGEANSIVFN